MDIWNRAVLAVPGQQNLRTAVDLSNRLSLRADSRDVIPLIQGVHTIGDSHYVLFPRHLYNFTNPSGPDPTLNITLLASLEKLCPLEGDGNVTTFLDLQTPIVFDNLYYQNLLKGNDLLLTDKEIYTGDNDIKQDTFFMDFVTGMIKMGNLNVLIGTKGEVHLKCFV